MDGSRGTVEFGRAITVIVTVTITNITVISIRIVVTINLAAGIASIIALSISIIILETVDDVGEPRFHLLNHKIVDKLLALL